MAGYTTRKWKRSRAALPGHAVITASLLDRHDAATFFKSGSRKPAGFILVAVQPSASPGSRPLVDPVDWRSATPPRGVHIQQTNRRSSHWGHPEHVALSRYEMIVPGVFARMEQRNQRSGIGIDARQIGSLVPIASITGERLTPVSRSACSKNRRVVSERCVPHGIPCCTNFPEPRSGGPFSDVGGERNKMTVIHAATVQV